MLSGDMTIETHAGAFSSAVVSSSSTATAVFHISIAIATATVSETMTSTLVSFPSTSSQASPPGSDDNNGECQLLGPFAILVQGALGGLALLSLVYKRWRERPQRPLKIWSFDASKQVFGSVLLHIANLVMSLFSSGQIQAIAQATATKVGATSEYQPNPCSFYLLNLAIDTTIGIPILVVLLKLLTVGASYTPLAHPPESIKSGHYGEPPRATWWLKQSMIYFIGLLGMKVCVFFIFQLCPWIVEVGDWALRWTEGNEAVQIAFVMLIFPLIMNALQYYIIDTFIKGKGTVEDKGAEGGRDDVDDEHGGLLANDHSGRGNSTDGDEADKADTSREDAKPGLISHIKEADVGFQESSSGESSSLGSGRQHEAVNGGPRV